MLPICTACGQYVRAFTPRTANEDCPFCGAKLQTAEPGMRLPTASSLALGLSLATLNACFGGVSKYGIAISDTFQDLSDVDEDGDGYSPAEGDCDDGDPARNPGEEETPGDGVDSNCDDEDDT